MVGGADTRERLACLVAGCPRSLGGGVGNRCGLRAVPEERLSEVELEHDVHPRRPGQLERTLEQSGGGALVAPPERAPAGGGEPLARALRKRCVGLAELALVADGLLEVVAEDLVQLDQLLAALSSQSAKRSCSSARVAFGSAS